MDPNSRPVIIRTDKSAEDFWSRERPDNQISPDLRVYISNQKNTPFGRQQRPFTTNNLQRSSSSQCISSLNRQPLAPIPHSNSRIVEREILQDEIKQMEAVKTPVPPKFVQQLIMHNTKLEQENKKMKYELENTHRQLMTTLKINKCLVSQVCDLYHHHR